MEKKAFETLSELEATRLRNPKNDWAFRVASAIVAKTAFGYMDRATWVQEVITETYKPGTRIEKKYLPLGVFTITERSEITGNFTAKNKIGAERNLSETELKNNWNIIK